MKPVLLNKVISVLILFSFFFSCTEREEDIHIPPTDEKVRIMLLTKSDDYSIPATRIGIADENNINLPWVLVFKATDPSITDPANEIDPDAIFVEATQAIVESGRQYVLLDTQTGPCYLLIIANPQDYFYYNDLPYSFTEPVLNSILTNQKLSEVSEKLLTEPLTSPTQPVVPFTENKSTPKSLPMSGFYGVSGINSHINLGVLELKRAVAKVFVNGAWPFTLQGITVINAPTQGQLFRLGNTIRNNNGKLTNYLASSGDPVVNIAKANWKDGILTTVNDPVYIYESDANENTSVILKIVFNGQTGFYKIGFLDDQGNKLPILRNHEYAINIRSVSNKGFETLEEAINSPISNFIHYDVIVKEKLAHEVIDNGIYYLGFTNSGYEVYGEGTLNYLNAFTVVTSNIDENVYPNQIKVSPGLILVSPTDGKIKPATNTALNPTDIIINLPNGINSGTIDIIYGDIIYNLTIKRKSPLEPNAQVIPFINNYYMAEIEDKTKDWLQLSLNSTSIREDNKLIYTENDGTFYLHIQENTQGIRRGIMYIADKQKQGRVKILIIQKGL